MAQWPPPPYASVCMLFYRHYNSTNMKWQANNYVKNQIKESFVYNSLNDHVHGRRKDFFQRGELEDFSKILPGRPKVVKFVFPHLKLRKQPFLLNISKSRLGCPAFRHPWRRTEQMITMTPITSASSFNTLRNSRTSTRRCWAAIQLSNHPELSGRAVHGEVDGLDIRGRHDRPFVLLRHTHRPQRRPYLICASKSGNVRHRCGGV